MRILLVRDGLGGAAVAGPQRREVAPHLPGAQSNAPGPQRLGKLTGGPGAPLAEQLPQPGQGLLPMGVRRFGAGRPRPQGGRARVAEALGRRPDGVRMAVEVGRDPRRRPAGVREQDHLQPVADHRRQVAPPQRQQLGPPDLVESDLDHAT